MKPRRTVRQVYFHSLTRFLADNFRESRIEAWEVYAKLDFISHHAQRLLEKTEFKSVSIPFANSFLDRVTSTVFDLLDDGDDFNIPQDDEPDATFTPPTWWVKPSWYGQLELYLKLGRSVIALVGGAGNGKTTTAEFALKMQGVPYKVIQGNDRTSKADLVGDYRLTANGEEWVDGTVTQAFREGCAVLIDEADAIDARVLMTLQNALVDSDPTGANRFVVVANGEKVYPEGTCTIIFTMNTTGQGANSLYSSRMKLDAATLDRISMIKTTYENEKELLVRRGFKGLHAQMVADWANNERSKVARLGLPIVISPRTMIRMCELLQHGIGWAQVIEWEYRGKLDERFIQTMDAAK